LLPKRGSGGIRGKISALNCLPKYREAHAFAYSIIPLALSKHVLNFLERNPEGRLLLKAKSLERSRPRPLSVPAHRARARASPSQRRSALPAPSRAQQNTRRKPHHLTAPGPGSRLLEAIPRFAVPRKETRPLVPRLVLRVATNLCSSPALLHLRLCRVT